MSQQPLNTGHPLGEDSRKLALANWVSQTDKDLNTIPRLTPISNDAGFRRYFRYPSLTPVLAVDAPPATEDSRQFIALATYLGTHGLGTPKVIAADIDQGFLLVEDFGDQLLYNALTPANANQLYGLALDNLKKLHQCLNQPGLVPLYDRALLRRELEIFSEWFVQAMLGYKLSGDETQMLEQVFTQLEDNALHQPQVLVHRDYHSRNLILRPDGKLGVIDFQGALRGAITYDLVSLLRDCYKRWPEPQVQTWALGYRQQAINEHLIPEISEQTFMRWFDWMGLQRHIKVLGIFARLLLRDGKPGYLKDLPLVIRYTLEVAEQHQELIPFANWFKEKLLPLIQKQSWYWDYRTAGDGDTE